MPIITRLVAGQRDPSRVNLYLDGRFAFALSADHVLARGLVRGTELTPSQVEELRSLGNDEKLLAKILNFLSYRPRSRQEIRGRLQHYAASPEQLVALEHRLESLGYLDDRAFATWFIAGRRSTGRYSTRHIGSELRSKGVDPELVKELLSDPAADREALRTLIAHKSALPREKLIGYLARRGFAYDLIKEALIE